MNKPTKIHIQDQQFKSRALCGRDWDRARGGPVASEGFVPPIVKNGESGSVNPTTCQQCVLAYRRRLASPQR